LTMFLLVLYGFTMIKTTLRAGASSGDVWKTIHPLSIFTKTAYFRY